jgi:hypothetical protein
VNTKQNGDIAEQRVAYELLLRGHSVLRPVGDRLPYDLAIDQAGRLVRVQIKLAWRTRPGSFAVDVRRHQTNRREHRHTKYQPGDFDFLIAWIREPDVFYVLPSSVACSFSGAISLTMTSRLRPCRSSAWREAWHVIQNTVE